MWTDPIFNYCERGASAAFWAEPINAVSNIAFILAALAAALEISRGDTRRPLATSGLAALVFVIGVGSFLFHTFANRWSALADVIPIAVFMFVYLAFALRAFYGAGWLLILAALALFAWTFQAAGGVQCPDFAGIAAFSRGACLNGTMRYAPAFGALLLAGAGLAAMRHPAGGYLMGAAAVFLLSMAARSLDWAVCDHVQFFGARRGAHALWHVLNGLTLYILLIAAIRHGDTRAAIATRPA